MVPEMIREVLHLLHCKNVGPAYGRLKRMDVCKLTNFASCYDLHIGKKY